MAKQKMINGNLSKDDLTEFNTTIFQMINMLDQHLVNDDRNEYIILLNKVKEHFVKVHQKVAEFCK